MFKQEGLLTVLKAIDILSLDDTYMPFAMEIVEKKS